MRLKRILTALTTSIAGAALVFAPAGAHGFKDKTTIVTPDDLALPPDATTVQESWYFYDDTANAPSAAELAGSYEFSEEAGGALNDGAVKMTNNAGTERWNIATNQFAGQDLDDIKKLAFDMYVPAASSGGTGTTLFLNFDVDFNNTTDSGYQNRLVYVPQDNGTPGSDAWETWNAKDGLWRWSGFAGNGNQWQDGNTSELRTWDDILTAFPNAEVFNESFTGQFLVRAGHPGPTGLVGFVDKVVFDHEIFDFELIYPVSGKITSPKAGSLVGDKLKLKAKYDDGDEENDDIVQWAVRFETCDAGTNTVLGNVDGHDDPYEWDGAKFSAKFSTEELEPGLYCFIFNPADDPGQDNVRETREFYIGPQERADCRDGGWEVFGDNFRSERDCLKFVKNHGDHHGHHGNGRNHGHWSFLKNWWAHFFSWFRR